MEALPVLVFPLVAILVGVGIWYAYRLKAKRREALFAFATQYGFQYSRDDPFGLTNLDFRLFRQGDGRGCENVVWGEWQGMSFREADYWYYTESTDSKGHTSKSYRHFSVVVADLRAWLPWVLVARENVFTRLADHLGFRDVELELEEFNRRFQVRSPDREFAFKLVDARMMRWLLATGDAFGFEVSGDKLLVHCRRLKPTALVPLIGSAKGFLDHVPRLVWNEYGVPPSTGPDESERSTA